MSSASEALILKMAYSQSKKSATDKKFQTLKVQLYGKEAKETYAKTNHAHSQNQKVATSGTFKFSAHTNLDKSHNILQTAVIETNFLKSDLLKILILASLAIGTQIIIYFMFIVRGS